MVILLPVIDSAEQISLELAQQKTEMIGAICRYPRIMSTELQRAGTRWPRHVGFEGDRLGSICPHANRRLLVNFNNCWVT